MNKFNIFFVSATLFTFSLAAQTNLIPFEDSAWKYLDNGSNQGTAWRGISFNDGTWKTGNGKFGYGITDAAINVSYGSNPNNKYITTYFRKNISIADTNAYTFYTASVKRDDGVAVYVNGLEVYRNNLPTGTLSYTTLASNATDDGNAVQTFNIKKSAFVSGTNVLAVEIHQRSGTTSDMAFDLSLVGKGLTAPSVVSINRQSPTTTTTSASSVTYRVTFSEKVSGVNVADFIVTKVSGTVTGIVASNGVVAVGTTGSIYDVIVSSITGTGDVRLDLKSTGTGITDTAGNTINGGYANGQTYTAQTHLVPFGSAWKYLDSGSNQGTAWRGISFNDGTWKTGNGKFGYGITDAAINVSYGSNPNNKYITTYFRKNISIADTNAYTFYTASVKRDDGVAVYVNGLEIYRNNLPTGTLSYTTLASNATDDGTAVQTFNIKKSAFVSGTNVLAVEIHQRSGTTSDMAFDLSLVGNSASPGNGAYSSPDSTTLCTTTVRDTNNQLVTVRFYGRKKAPTGKFTIIMLPDTQFYTAQKHNGNNKMFKDQTDWIVKNKAHSNIVYVGQLGDCTDDGDAQEIEWKRADTAIRTIEDSTLPYGVCVGNHDQSPNGSVTGTTKFYNKYFGSSRFTGRSYYGGHRGINNNNNYQLFSASGIDFLIISLEYNTTTSFTAPGGALDWADSLVKTNPNRKVIVLSHFVLALNGTFSFLGNAVYNRLKIYPNFILMTGAHENDGDGENRRSDTYNGNTVHTILSNYQSRPYGGNGLLRIYEFDPSTNIIAAQTYSPYRNTYETDSDSQFNLTVNLISPAPFALVGEVSNVISGSKACVSGPSLQANADYEWYAEVFDGQSTTKGPTWSFTTRHQ